MRFRTHKIWIGLIILLVSGLSCQLPAGKNSTDQEIRPTTSAAERRLPTEAAEELSPLPDTGDQLIIHPSQTFEILIPAGWTSESDENGSLYASEPQGEGAIYITVNYTGHALTAEDFERYIQAREENFFNYFEDYNPGESEINSTKDWAVYRKSVDFNGIPETIDTYYYRINNAVFTMDTWMETSRIPEYETLYQTSLDSFKFQSEGVENFYLYNYVWVFRDSLDLFSFETPISWAYREADVGGVLEDQFWAPDENAALTHHLIYQPANLSETEMETEVINKLKNSLPDQTKGLKVNSRETLETGVYQLNWISKESDWQGLVVYRVYKNNLLILNGMYANIFEDSYLSTIQYGLDYYSVPAATEE